MIRQPATMKTNNLFQSHNRAATNVNNSDLTKTKAAKYTLCIDRNSHAIENTEDAVQFLEKVI